jgi:NAD(P)H-hydrate epimerase
LIGLPEAGGSVVVGDVVLSREAVRALDRRAIEEYGVPSVVLMENAGRACADEARSMLGDARGPVLALCGPGNNGGDGLVIARTLWNRGVEVEAVFVGARDRLEAGSNDFATNLRLWRGLGRTIECVATPSEVRGLAPRLERARLVVDALFGTGLARELGEPWLGVIRLVNEARRPVLAVDLPSGLDADTGAVLGAAVRAALTVTFVARKPGFACGSGPELCGRIVVAEIGIPRPLLDAAGRG